MPLGPERESVRRLPWVSFGYMALLAAAHLALFLSPGDREPLREAWDYYRYFPDLTLASPLPEVFGVDEAAGTKDYGLTNRPSRQREMDRLAADAVAALERLPLSRFAFNPEDFKPETLLTHLFLSPSLTLLVVQLFFLYTCATFVEDRWGRVFFPLFLAAGGVFAALAIAPFSGWMLLTGGGTVTAVAMGAFTGRFYDERVRTLFAPPWQLGEEIYLSPFILFPLWLALQFGVTFVFGHHLGGSNAVYLAQIFAFGFGLITALIIRLFNLEPILYLSAYDRLPEPDRIRYEVDNMLRLGNAEGALARLDEACRKYPEDDAFLEDYWGQAVRMGRAREAAEAGRTVIARCLARKDAEQAFFFWREWSQALPEETLEADRMATLIQALLQAGHGRNAAEAAACAVDRLPPGLSGPAAMRLAQAVEMADPALSPPLAAKLLATTKLNGKDREALRAVQGHAPNDAPEEPPVSSIPLAAVEPDPDMMTADDDPFAPTRISALQILEAAPTAWNAEGLHIEKPGGAAQTLAFGRIKAVAAGAIREIGSPPFLLIDLLLDCPMEALPAHRVVRLHSRRFDPRRLVDGVEAPAEAARLLVARLLTAAKATALPDEDALLGTRFPVYGSVPEYERQTYGV